MRLRCRWRGHRWPEFEKRYWPHPSSLALALMLHGRTAPRDGTLRLVASARNCRRCGELDARMEPTEWWHRGAWRTDPYLAAPVSAGEPKGDAHG